MNKKILVNIIKKNHFPNLLFYGPPGTGKTTTIINLINYYQEVNNEKDKSLYIHLNASDERGIDIIRNQINQFVNSKTLFNQGMKFVILDEVDYMTKNAQQALRYLLQNYNNNIRFCLICNYISRIDEGLQNEFLKLRFNQLPTNETQKFLNEIVSSEKLDFNSNYVNMIRDVYKSDIRSMVNFMQSSQGFKSNELYIMDNNLWEELLNLFKQKKDVSSITKFINEISFKYNIDKKNIIKNFFNYVIREKKEMIKIELLNFTENIIHLENSNATHCVNYFVVKFNKLINP
jgi:replication factor C subunit 3/5